MVFAIDLGSNTLRACVMHARNGHYEILKEAERVVGSAHGLYANSRLDSAAKERVKRGLGGILSEFSDLIYDENSRVKVGDTPKFCLPYVAVATEAFRQASDSDEFFAEIYAEFYVKFYVINSVDEMKLTRLGIENRLNILEISPQNILTIDLGGASTEISDGESGKSFGFGIVKFCNENPSTLINCRTYKFSDIAESVTYQARKFLDSLKITKIVLTGGVPTSICAMKMGLNTSEYSAQKVNGEVLKYGDFDLMMDKILAMTAKDAKEILGANRADLIVAGALLLRTLLEEYKELEYIVVDDGLREGACINYLQNL